MELNKIYSNLKSLIVGTKTSAIDRNLDLSIRNILNYRTKQGVVNYVDVIKNIISRTSTTDLSYLQADAFGSGLGLYGQNYRFAQYQLYTSILKMIPYCKRALQILTDNIISPDDITKVVLNVTSKNISVDEDENQLANIQKVKNLLETLNIEDDIEKIVENTLKDGDYFYEVTTESSFLAAKSSVFHESIIDSRSLDNLNSCDNIKFVSETKEYGKIERDFILDFSANNFLESKSTSSQNELSNIKIVYHKATTVIKLQTSSMPICLGYLIFPEEAFDPTYQVRNQEVNNLCASILSKVKSNVVGADQIKDLPDMKQILKRMIQSTTSFSTLIRYVPPELMGSFTIESDENRPYGMSIFHVCEFSAKLLIALETALAIQRLSRSTEKRKVSVEIGLPRDAKKAVEMLKEQFKKRKVTIDSFGSVDTIPSTIATFEDIYVPQRDGKPFVDVSTFDQGNVDTARKVEEIKYVRDQLVSSFGIPAPFLNIEENTSWRTTLTEENILFARSIVSFQKIFSKQLHDMLHTVIKIIDPDFSLHFRNIRVTLPPPKSLQFEREAKYLQDASTMIQSLSDIGIPKEYSIKKFLTQIDWDDVKKFKINKQIEEKLGNKEDTNNDDESNFKSGNF